MTENDDVTEMTPKELAAFAYLCRNEARMRLLRDSRTHLPADPAACDKLFCALYTRLAEACERASNAELRIELGVVTAREAGREEPKLTRQDSARMLLDRLNEDMWLRDPRVDRTPIVTIATNTIP